MLAAFLCPIAKYDVIFEKGVVEDRYLFCLFQIDIYAK